MPQKCSLQTQTYFLLSLGSVRRLPKMFLRIESYIKLKTAMPEIIAVPQSINYNEIPVPGVCQFFFVLLLHKRSG